jgi:hypothetical protein
VRDVHGGDCDSGLGRIAEPEPLDVVDHDRGGIAAVQAEQLGHQGAQQLAVVVRVLEWQRLHGLFHRRLADGQRLVEDDTPGRCHYQLGSDLDADPLLQLDRLALESQNHLVL